MRVCAGRRDAFFSNWSACRCALSAFVRFSDMRTVSHRSCSLDKTAAHEISTATKKLLGRLQPSLVNLTRSIWQQTMKRKFVRILVVVLAAFALFAFVYPDDPSESDSACSQSEILKESSVRIPTYRDRRATHRDQQALAVDSTRLFDSNKITCSPSSSERTTSPTLLSLAACILRC